MANVNAGYSSSLLGDSSGSIFYTPQDADFLDVVRRDASSMATTGLTVPASDALLNTGVGLTSYFLMSGIDVDCGSPTVRTWIVRGSADFDASRYTGPKCGVAALTAIHVASTWEE